ncbi:hypothetical protein M0805_003739 [Coniferiporia weirii]|nr:hypothetical protein M0805_003739 [Coniferiporia weirii]
MSSIADNVSFAAASDAARFANDSRTEHPAGLDAALAAAQDAARIAAEDPTQGPLHDVPSVNLARITRAEAQILASEEHRALGYRPPHGSLASQAQSAAERNVATGDLDPDDGRGTQRTSALKEAARVDAARVAAERGDAVGAVPTVDLNGITKDEAARLQSEEQRMLGHRPPPGSLAAQAQSAADLNLTGNRINGGPAGIDPNTVTQEDAARLMSEEHRRLGHRPPHDSLAAQVQSIIDGRAD